MVQEIIIFIIFALAAAYVIRLLIANFRPKAGGCAKGCGSACSTIDFEKIKKDLEAKSTSLR